MTTEQRRAALGGAAVAGVLSVFAVGSMATAELQQNAVQQAIEAGEEFTCNTLQDLDCDGVLDLDLDGNPIEAPAEGTSGADPFQEGGTEEEAVEPGAQPAPVDGDGAGADGVVPVPGETTPPTTDPLPAPPALLAVGDSVMLGAARNLDELGFTVDAIESRAWVNGLSYVEGLGSQDRLPDTLVIHLGTNGPIRDGEMDRMMQAVADVPLVLMLTNDVDRPYTADNNALIYDAVAANANVEILDWQGLTPGCPGDCFESDGFHLKPDGRTYYAALIDGRLSEL